MKYLAKVEKKIRILSFPVASIHSVSFSLSFIDYRVLGNSVGVGWESIGIHIKQITVKLYLSPAIHLKVSMASEHMIRRASRAVPEAMRNFEGAGAVTQHAHLSGTLGNTRFSKVFVVSAGDARSAAGRVPASAGPAAPARAVSTTWAARGPAPRHIFARKSL